MAELKLPVNRPPWLVRGRRLARRTPARAVQDFRRAFVNEAQAISLALAALTSWIGLRTATIPQMVDVASGWFDAAQALLYVALGWAFICLVRAPFILHYEETKKGKWFGNRFIYNEPMLVAMFRCKPTGNVEMHQFKVPDVEPLSYIHFSIELDGGRHLAEIGLGGAIITGLMPFRNWPGTGGVLLPPSRKAIFQIRLPTNALSVTARIYCHSYIVGDHDEQDGTTGNFRFRRSPASNGAGGSP